MTKYIVAPILETLADLQTMYVYNMNSAVKEYVKCNERFFSLLKVNRLQDIKLKLKLGAHLSHVIVILGYVIKLNNESVTVTQIWLAEQCWTNASNSIPCVKMTIACDKCTSAHDKAIVYLKTCSQGPSLFWIRLSQRLKKFPTIGNESYRM